MTNFVQIQALFRNPPSIGSSLLGKDNNSQTKPLSSSREILLIPKRQFELKSWGQTESGRRITYMKKKGLFAMGFCCQWIHGHHPLIHKAQLFAFSLFPYLGFLYFITKSKSAPKLTLFGFYFLLAFVGATKRITSILVLTLSSCVSALLPPTLQYQQEFTVHYGTSLSNVDWLHGGAESLLTLTNIFIVLGLREALRKATDVNRNASNSSLGVKEEDKSSI
ncbi:hypothetical protein DH2020_005703 [Rehmannia glutinosa]|uniref:Transmembrane protein n=1 Tax=Rehmannia glutinosa TaxID=99300 RepID=A0ABR0XGU3_REHGL